MMGLAYEVHIRKLLNNSKGGYLLVIDKELREHKWAVDSILYYQKTR